MAAGRVQALLIYRWIPCCRDCTSIGNPQDSPRRRLCNASRHPYTYHHATRGYLPTNRSRRHGHPYEQSLPPKMIQKCLEDSSCKEIRQIQLTKSNNKKKGHASLSDLHCLFAWRISGTDWGAWPPHQATEQASELHGPFYAYAPSFGPIFSISTSAWHTESALASEEVPGFRLQGLQQKPWRRNTVDFCSIRAL